MKVRWERRRIEAIEALGSVCLECGTASNLHFHHIDPENKIGTIARLSSYSEAKFWAEISKRVLLCEPCHKAHHRSQ